MPTRIEKFGHLTDSMAAIRKTLVGAFGIMVIAVTVSSAINYLFNIVMNRMLGRAAFGDLYSMESIFLIVTMGALSVQTVITKYIADFEATEQHNKSRFLVQSFARWLLMAGGVVMVVSLAIAWPAADVLKLQSPVFVIILGSSVAATLFLTLPYGVLQGQQRFLGLGLAHISMSSLRIVSGVVLVAIGIGVYGALGAATIAGIVVAAITVYVLKEMFFGPVEVEEEFHPLSALKYLVPVASALFFIIFLTQMDVVLVKALFSRSEAGTYSYAALAGKAVLFLPEGISLVMFPRVSELKAKNQPTRRVLGWSLLAVSAMVAVVAAFYALFPNFTGYFFAGEKGKDIASLVGLFGLVMAVFAVVKLLAFYHLALEKKGFILLFVAAGIAEVVGILLFHGSLKQVITVMLLVAAFLLVTNLVLAFREKPGRGYSEVEYLPM